MRDQYGGLLQLDIWHRCRVDVGVGVGVYLILIFLAAVLASRNDELKEAKHVYMVKKRA